MLWMKCRKLAEGTKEHTRVVRAADTRRYEIADHCWKYNHDFDWENKKIMDYEANTTRRKIKETVHSLSNNNHINGISELKSGIFARRAMVDQTREGLCYQGRNLTFLICLTWEKIACSDLPKFYT